MLLFEISYGHLFPYMSFLYKVCMVHLLGLGPFMKYCKNYSQTAVRFTMIKGIVWVSIFSFLSLVPRLDEHSPLLWPKIMYYFMDGRWEFHSYFSFDNQQLQLSVQSLVVYLMFIRSSLAHWLVSTKEDWTSWCLGKRSNRQSTSNGSKSSNVLL